MQIKKIKGYISKTIDLTPTSKEVHIAFEDAFEFEAGSFVNVFMDIDGERVRRAYSISTYNSQTNEVQISVRLLPNGKMSPLFWQEDIIGSHVEIMGPLGLNTSSKLMKNKLFLFGFGIGSGVIKAIAQEELLLKNKVLHIMLGQKNEDEIIHKAFFDSITNSAQVEYILSNDPDNSQYKKGYIQDHISHLDFNESDIFICGQEKACLELKQKIESTNPKDCSFFIEGFH